MTTPINLPSRPAERLDGKVAVVTGAGSLDPEHLGIGAATAAMFAQQAARVVIVDLSEERARLTAHRIEQSFGGPAPITCQADMRDYSACERVLADTLSNLGRIDVLVNNAGTGGVGSITDISLDDWHRVIDGNLTSTMHMSRCAIPHLVSDGGGAIINVASIAAVRGAGGSAYAAAKGAVVALGRDMAFTYGRQGIRVNTVLPGHLFSPMGARELIGGIGQDQYRDARRRIGLLGTEGTALDVAHTILFLASDEARWITGAEFVVDAGTTSAMPLALQGLLSGETS